MKDSVNIYALIEEPKKMNGASVELLEYESQFFEVDYSKWNGA